jgi:hypothetical protein
MWIDISKRNPTPGDGWVLTYEADAIMPIKVNRNLNDFYLKFGYGDTSKITHWMKMPAPPGDTKICTHSNKVRIYLEHMGVVDRCEDCHLALPIDKE